MEMTKLTEMGHSSLAGFHSLELLTCKAQRMYFQSQDIKEAFTCYDGFRKYFLKKF